MTTLLAAWERHARLAPSITVAMLREHADLIAHSLNIRVRRSSTDYAMAALRLVGGPAIVDDATYASRLHEFGHCETQAAKAAGVTIRTGLRTIANTAGEAAAWHWARAHALMWTAPMQEALRESLASYQPYARHGLEDPLWQELDRVNGCLTLGYARHQPQARLGRERYAETLRLASQWRSEVFGGLLTLDQARNRLNSVTGRYR